MTAVILAKKRSGFNFDPDFLPKFFSNAIIIDMQILTKSIKLADLKSLAEKMFGTLVKGVVDIEREVVAIDGEMHSDLAEELVANGSRGIDTWGFNVYPEAGDKDWLEFDSMINVKPLLNNRSRTIENPITRTRAKDIIKKFIES